VASSLASAAARSTACSSLPVASAVTPPKVRVFCVSVPVLSDTSVSIAAASSTAGKRVTSTPWCASCRLLMAVARV